MQDAATTASSEPSGHVRTQNFDAVVAEALRFLEMHLEPLKFFEVSGVEVSAEVSEAMELEAGFLEVVSEVAGVSGVLWLGHL